MEMSAMAAQMLGSVQQAIGLATLRNAMHQDSLTVNTLLQDMQAANTRAMELSVTPHKGSHIDIRV